MPDGESSDDDGGPRDEDGSQRRQDPRPDGASRHPAPIARHDDERVLSGDVFTSRQQDQAKSVSLSILVLVVMARLLPWGFGRARAAVSFMSAPTLTLLGRQINYL